MEQSGSNAKYVLTVLMLRPECFRRTRSLPWISYKIRKISDCACAGNAGNVFPATDFKGNRGLTIPACITARASRTCRDACRDRQPVMAGKRSRHSRRMRNPQFYVSGKRPMAAKVLAIKEVLASSLMILNVHDIKDPCLPWLRFSNFCAISMSRSDTQMTMLSRTMQHAEG